MKWPWKRDYDDDYDYTPTGKKRQPQTLKTVAEKILARKMKQDPDGYGLAISERLLRVAPPETKTLRDQLEELQELKGILAELGGTSEGGGIAGIVSSLLNSDLGTQLGGMIAGVANRPQLDQGLPRTIPREALQPPPMPEPPQEQAILLGDLLNLLDMEAEEAVSNLPLLWKQKLAGLNYMQVNGLLIDFIDDPTWGSMVKTLLSPEKKVWLTQVLRLCQEEVKEA